jgi:serine/threonine kinase 32
MGVLCCKPEPVDFDGPVDLYHFYLLRAVGKGAFGKVRVVQHKQTKVSRSLLVVMRAGVRILTKAVFLVQNLYALKYINKAKCIKMRAVSNIIQERRLLEEIESPFVCNLRVSGIMASLPCFSNAESHSHPSTPSKMTRTCSWCWT